jgi:hypothetical protein
MRESRRSALSGIFLKCNFYRGTFRGGSIIHFRFKLLCSLVLPVAPTAEALGLQGAQAVYTTHGSWAYPNPELLYRYLSDANN